MLEVDLRTIRLFVHVLAATVWVGGQLTFAGLVPAMRSLGDDATRTLARQFDRLAWPAFGVLVATGTWNLLEVDVGPASSEYRMSLALKLLLVVMTGAGAAVHRIARGRTVLLALGGAGAVGALFVGIQLHG